MEKGMTEDEMVGCYHWLNGHEFEQAPGDGEGQGGLVCCSPWGCKEPDTNWATEQQQQQQQQKVVEPEGSAEMSPRKRNYSSEGGSRRKRVYYREADELQMFRVLSTSTQQLIGDLVKRE